MSDDSVSDISYGGICPRCRVRHSLPISKEALSAAHDLNKLICQHQRLDFEVSIDACNPLFNTEYLWTKGPGRMLGVMIAIEGPDADGDLSESSYARGTSNRMHVLKAFSGQITESWHIAG